MDSNLQASCNISILVCNNSFNVLKWLNLCAILECSAFIFVYSPKFKLPNGIHVGMTAEKLINNYGATLQLNENEGGESIAFITFDIPNLSDFVFVADKEDLLKVKGEYFLDGWNPQTGSFNENFRNDIEREAKKYCKLGIIVVGNEFDTF